MRSSAAIKTERIIIRLERNTAIPHARRNVDYIKSVSPAQMPKIPLSEAPALLIQAAQDVGAFFKTQYGLAIDMTTCDRDPCGRYDEMYTLVINFMGQLCSAPFPKATQLILQYFTDLPSIVRTQICLEDFGRLKSIDTDDVVGLVRQWFNNDARTGVYDHKARVAQFEGAKSDFRRYLQIMITPLWTEGRKRGFSDTDLTVMMYAAVRESSQSTAANLTAIEARLDRLI